MKKSVCIVFLLMISILAGCKGDSVDHIGLKELGIDKSKGQLNHYIDTHGGFLGDGCTYIEIEFYGENADAVEDELKENESWKELPLSDNLQTAVYGDEHRNSLVSFEDKIPSISEISNGYYYFNDRHRESTDPGDDSYLFSRSSYNFDIILYDRDQHILYIFQVDT